MASIITEIYVSIDNLEFTKLDLFKDESFTIKYSKKDLQDITKVFAPFSQNFSIPATPKNKQAFGFFGNTEVVKVNSESKFNCKVYTNGVLNQTGILKLEGVKYKNNKADTFTANFNTNLLSLKERIGDDTLHDLSNGNHITKWTAKEVYQRLSSVATLSGLRYFAPLISNNRVWNYDANTVYNDNIAYKSGNNPNSDKCINSGEIRPALKFLDIFGLIKTKYNITINTPLELTPQLADLYVYGNAETITDGKEKRVSINNAFTNPSGVNKIVYNSTDKTFKIDKTSTVYYIRLDFQFLNTIISDDTLTTTDVKFKCYYKSNNVLFYEDSGEFDFGTVTPYIKFPLSSFTAGSSEFYITLECDKLISWSHLNIQCQFNLYSGSPIISQSINNINADDVGLNKIDLIKTLPDIKIIDFLNSYFRTFNLSIYDSSPNDENLFLLTPQDINTTGQVYSKLEVDYTRFADAKEVTKSVGNDYNYYNFKLKQSEYRSNIDFKKQFGVEYGQTSYPLVKPAKAKEFKVETEFSIIPPIVINGTSNVYTAYGFNGESAEKIGGLFRYTPNSNELTLFYSHGNTSLGSNALSCQNINPSNVLTNSQLTSYIKVMPFNKTNLHSLAFSILVINGVNYTNSLFQLYYSQLISRLLNPNALSQTYTINLPSSEIYLNDATISAGTGNTPTGFRLQNEIIIGETKFEILEASIDTTTGKSKLTLLNF